MPFSVNCKLLPLLSSNSARTLTINGMIYHTLQNVGMYNTLIIQLRISATLALVNIT